MAICRASCPSFVTNFYLISRSFTPVSFLLFLSLSFPLPAADQYGAGIYLLYAHRATKMFTRQDERRSNRMPGTSRSAVNTVGRAEVAECHFIVI